MGSQAHARHAQTPRNRASAPPLRALLHAGLQTSGSPHPVTAIAAGRASVTLHAIDDGDEWEWDPDERTGYFGVVFPVDDARGSIPCDDSAEQDPRAPILLRPCGGRARLRWTRGGAATVWLPTTTIGELGVDLALVQDRPALTTAALAARSYVTTVATTRPGLGVVEELVMERALIDMTAGVFFASGEHHVIAANRVSTFTRARLLFESRFSDAAFGVRGAAEELHLSERHLERLFRSQGMSPSSYLRSLRTDYAQVLLASRHETGMTMRIIADLSGFGSVRSLRRALSAWADDERATA